MDAGRSGGLWVGLKKCIDDLALLKQPLNAALAIIT
jgi:hypothetical protein